MYICIHSNIYIYIHIYHETYHNSTYIRMYNFNKNGVVVNKGVSFPPNQKSPRAAKGG